MADEYIQEHRAKIITEAHERTNGEGPKIKDFDYAELRCEIGGPNMIVGYARISTDGQTLDAQRSTLSTAGAKRVFAEKLSGVVTERKALARAVAALTTGNVPLVSRLDRLPRSTRDLLNVLDAVAKAGTGFRSLADAFGPTAG